MSNLHSFLRFAFAYLTSFYALSHFFLLCSSSPPATA